MSSTKRLLVRFLIVVVIFTAHCLANHQHDHRKTSPRHKSIENRKPLPQHKSLVPSKGEKVSTGKKPPVPPQNREKPPHEDHKSHVSGGKAPKRGANKPPVEHSPQLPPGRNELPLKKLPPSEKKPPLPPHKPPSTY
ncbi:hypothetical protein BVRB_3g049220 [Beta vulgaris subsp. vulgaris]|nr:hypothetical protein BVRB_3g049220 [Beta vulgaris subsp. vulgaris]